MILILGRVLSKCKFKNNIGNHFAAFKNYAIYKWHKISCILYLAFQKYFNHKQ